MYPSNITHHFTTGTPILQVSWTFYKSHWRTTTINMNKLEANDGPSSSQTSSFESIWPTLPFHIKILSLITFCKCVQWVKDSETNACQKGRVSERPWTLAALQPSQVRFPWHSSITDVNSAFCILFLHGMVFCFVLKGKKGCAIHKTRLSPPLVNSVGKNDQPC